MSAHSSVKGLVQELVHFSSRCLNTDPLTVEHFWNYDFTYHFSQCLRVKAGTPHVGRRGVGGGGGGGGGCVRSARPFHIWLELLRKTMRRGDGL